MANLFAGVKMIPTVTTDSSGVLHLDLAFPGLSATNESHLQDIGGAIANAAANNFSLAADAEAGFVLAEEL